MPNSRDIYNTLAEKSRASELSYEFYDTMVNAIRNAISETTPEARDAAMLETYQYITNMAARSTLVHRGIMTMSQKLFDKYGNNKTFVSAMDTSNAVEQLFGEVCQELGGNYQCKPRMGMTYQDYMDYIRSLANSVMMQDVQNEFFKQATPKILSDSMSLYSRNLSRAKNHTYSCDFSIPENRNIAEVYSLYENAWQRIRSAGFLGNLIHPIDFFRNVGVIRSANKVFEKFGFNKETDFIAAKEAFERTTDECANKDNTDLAELKSDVKTQEAFEKAKANNINEITMARDKLQKAIERDKIPGNRPVERVNAVLAKYGKSIETSTAREGRIEAFNTSLEEDIARQYDGRRDTEGVKDYVKAIFYHATTMMVNATLGKNEKLNTSQIIKDASDIAVMMADDFTVLYDAPDLKDVAKNSAFGGYNCDGVTRIIERALGSNHNEEYNLADIRAEIEKTMAEYKNSIIENSQTEKVETTETEISNEEKFVETTTQNEPMRMSFHVNPSDLDPETEEVQAKITDQSLTKQTEMFK